MNPSQNHRARCGGLITWARRFAAKKWPYRSRGASLDGATPAGLIALPATTGLAEADPATLRVICEPTGRANAQPPTVVASAAKQSILQEVWIASLRSQ